MPIRHNKSPTPHLPQRVLSISDSLASLTAIQDFYSTNLLVQHILIVLNLVRTTSLLNVVFIWARGHYGIPGNESTVPPNRPLITLEFILNISQHTAISYQPPLDYLLEKPPPK